MKTLFIALQALLVLAFTSFAEEADSHDKAAGDVVVLMTKLADALKGVKDVDSAEKGKVTLNKLLPDFQKMGERMKKLGKPAGDVDKGLEEKYGKKMSEAMQAFIGELTRISTESKESMEVLQEPIDAIGKAMTSADKASAEAEGDEKEEKEEKVK